MTCCNEQFTALPRFMYPYVHSSAVLVNRSFRVVLTNFFSFIFIACLTLPFHARAQLTDIELDNLTIMADRALAIPLSKLASDYSRDHNMTITVAFAPSFEQTLNIQEGAAADLFISAHPKSLEHLKQRGLFDVNSLKPVVKANLSLLYTGDAEAFNYKDEFSKILEQPADYIAITSPAATAEGFYAGQSLNHFKPPHLPVAEMPDTESTLNMLKKQEAPIFAIIFEPDALLNAADKIIATLHKDWHSEAIFTSAVIPSNNMQGAREFQRFLLSDKAQREFIKYRFYPAN